MSQIFVCPVCGFSFKPLSSKTEKKKIKCPMCQYEFSNFPISSFDKEEFEKKF